MSTDDLIYFLRTARPDSKLLFRRYIAVRELVESGDIADKKWKILRNKMVKLFGEPAVILLEESYITFRQNLEES